MSLLPSVRKFWYDNEPGTFEVDGHPITRRQIQVYGGPSPDFDACPLCQRCEWLSRVRQKKVFRPHPCPTAKACEDRCGKQGSELWTHAHQDHGFSAGCDPALNSPRCLALFPGESKPRLWKRWWGRYCDWWIMNLRRALAQACQVDVVPTLENVKWDRYDFLFMQNCAGYPTFPKPPIPIVMSGEDMYKGDLQGQLDRLRPEVFLTSCPTTWQKLFRFAPETEMAFWPQAMPQFFTRPNLGMKEYDLLSVGSPYPPRMKLYEQIKPLADTYKIGFWHEHGYYRNTYGGPVAELRDGDQCVRRYLNAWSAFLGNARYVTFGPPEEPYQDIMVAKVCEVLGSGAVPIMPESPDMKRLDIEPFVHYIPLSEIWEDNGNLIYYLTSYPAYQHIAINAVDWHRENVDTMLFDGFEDVVQRVTHHKYPRRLIGG
jgi:hypothetical protein